MHEISRTKIKRRARNKMSSVIKETLALAMKNKGWREVAQILASSTRKYSSLNLSLINLNSSEGETIVVVGKVLSKGNLTKKIKLCALGISESAHAKLSHSKSQFVHLIDEIKKNPKAEGVKILR